MNIKNNKEVENYWSLRYENSETSWDIGSCSTPLKSYIDQLKDKTIKILIPGAGNAYEAEYLYNNGFKNTYVLDIAKKPLTDFKNRISSFPDENLIQENFFIHEGSYDLIIEQTFFCSFPPTQENRSLYAKQVDRLLKKDGKLVGLWFDFPLTGDLNKRPFGGNKKAYLKFFEPYFSVRVFEKCYNSIAPRQGNELFGIFVK